MIGWLRLRPKGSPLILITPARYQTILARWRDCHRRGIPWINNYLVNNTVRDLRAHAVKAGLTDCEKLTVHCFRKTCGQNWANHLPMNVVKELMGHASITTTAEFYTAIEESAADRLREVFERVA